MHNLTKNTTIYIAIVIGALLTGTFLPWFTLDAGIISVSVSGIDNTAEYYEGYASLAAAVMCLSALLIGKRYLFMITCFGMLGIGVYDLVKILDANHLDVAEEMGWDISTSPGIGIFTVLAAAIFGIVVSFTMWETKPQPLPDPQPIYGDANHLV